MAVADPLELTPQEVKSLQQSGEPLSLIDVREPAEWALAKIESATLIPMGSVPSNFQQIESKADEGRLIVYCHHGMRSLQVVSWLRERGIASSYSMAGGIDRWSREIDSSVPLY
jgi:rhodanese-related sulfurtransferase